MRTLTSEIISFSCFALCEGAGLNNVRWEGWCAAGCVEMKESRKKPWKFASE